MSSSLISQQWVDDLAASHNLVLNKTLFLYRFAIATDVRAVFPQNDQSDGRPPLAGTTRPVTFTPVLPPPSNPFIDPGEPAWDMRTALSHGRILDIHSSLRLECGAQVLDITITPQCLTDEEFTSGVASEESAAVLLGEFATFWGPHSGHT